MVLAEIPSNLSILTVRFRFSTLHDLSIVFFQQCEHSSSKGKAALDADQLNATHYCSPCTTKNNDFPSKTRTVFITRGCACPVMHVTRAKAGNL